MKHNMNKKLLLLQKKKNWRDFVLMHRWGLETKTNQSPSKSRQRGNWEEREKQIRSFQAYYPLTSFICMASGNQWFASDSAQQLKLSRRERNGWRSLVIVNGQQMASMNVCAVCDIFFSLAAWNCQREKERKKEYTMTSNIIIKMVIHSLLHLWRFKSFIFSIFNLLKDLMLH